MATKTDKSTLLLGWTSAVGRKLLAELLASDGEHGRRMSAPESAPGHLAAKLEQKTINFEELDKAVNKYRSRNSSWYVNT